MKIIRETTDSTKIRVVFGEIFLAVKSPGCSYKGFRFSSEHPHRTSQNYL